MEGDSWQVFGQKKEAVLATLWPIDNHSWLLSVQQKETISNPLVNRRRLLATL
jgi:hypothetical protein